MSPILCRIESGPAKPVSPRRPPTLHPPRPPPPPQACISRARASARSPGVARVTLGLLPRHRLDQRGPGAIISALAASTPGLEWQIGSRGERVTSARQEIYFEEEECVSGVRDKRATFYVVNCTRATRATRIDPRPKDTRTRREALSGRHNARAFISQSHPKYDWIRGLFAGLSSRGLNLCPAAPHPTSSLN